MLVRHPLLAVENHLFINSFTAFPKKYGDISVALLVLLHVENVRFSLAQAGALPTVVYQESKHLYQIFSCRILLHYFIFHVWSLITYGHRIYDTIHIESMYCINFLTRVISVLAILHGIYNMDI